MLLVKCHLYFCWQMRRWFRGASLNEALEPVGIHSQVHLMLRVTSSWRWNYCIASMGKKLGQEALWAEGDIHKIL